MLQEAIFNTISGKTIKSTIIESGVMLMTFTDGTFIQFECEPDYEDMSRLSVGNFSFDNCNYNAYIEAGIFTLAEYNEPGCWLPQW